MYSQDLTSGLWGFFNQIIAYASERGAYLKTGNKPSANTFWGNSRYEEIQDRCVYFQNITGTWLLLRKQLLFSVMKQRVIILYCCRAVAFCKLC